MYTVPVAQVDSKNIFRMFSRTRPYRRIALTLPERTWFCVLCALFEQIPFGMDIFLKLLPYAELKIVTNSVYPVIWSRGFPTL